MRVVIIVTAAPAPTSTPGGGIVGPLLTNPGGFFGQLGHQAAVLATSYGPPAAAVVTVVIVVTVAVRGLLRRRHHRGLAADARLVEVAVPPEVDPEAAERFWATLVGLLRPAWRRLLDGQPHLAWQYHATRAGTTISIWVPGTVAPGLVERAVETCWPAARTRTIQPPPDPTPAGRALVTGGTLRLHGPDVLPLRADLGDGV
ncbi:MAG: type VI secretion protein, partial [Actinobacteria bacterium]|nr:type VI secretion protein [Actinomycetota bacterium]